MTRSAPVLFGSVAGYRSRWLRRDLVAGLTVWALVIRVESGLFFANADHIRDRIRAVVATGAVAVVLDGESSPFIDITAAGMLDQLTRELAARGVRLYLARDIGQVRDVLHHTDNGSALVIYRDVDAAVTAARAQSQRPSNK